MTRIIIVLILIIAISCKSKQVNKDLDRPFIKSYQELNKECTSILSAILKPYEYENDTLRINKVYKLDLVLDSTLYSKDDLKYNYFVGIRFKPDLYDIQIFNIDLKIGAISTCRIMPDESLIINNLDYLFTDFSNLKNCKDLNIPDSLFKYAHHEKTMFRHIAWTNTYYGKWIIEPENKFADNRFNNIWIFKPEKGFLLINAKSDTLLVDSIDLQGNSLLLLKSKCEFEIATQTQTKILIKESGEKDFKCLKKMKE